MANFTGQNAQFTPATNADNWTLDGGTTVSSMGKVKMINWGGSGTTSTGYRTRWCRPTTAASSTFTAITTQGSNPLPTSVCRFGSFAVAATLPAEPASLFSQNWNVLGGGGVIVLPIGGEWFIVGSATTANQQISCRNTAGVDANLSNYGIQWEE